MSKKATYRFNDKMDEWLQKQAEIKGSSKNDIIRDLISEKMKSTA